METKNNAIRDARTLGIPKMLLLGLQHMFAMFGATILVPILVNNYFKGEGLSVFCKVYNLILKMFNKKEKLLLSQSTSLFQ